MEFHEIFDLNSKSGLMNEVFNMSLDRWVLMQQCIDYSVVSSNDAVEALKLVYAQRGVGFYPENQQETAAFFYLLGLRMGENKVSNLVVDLGSDVVNDIAGMVVDAAYDYAKRNNLPISPDLQKATDYREKGGNANPFKKKGFDIPK